MSDAADDLDDKGSGIAAALAAAVCAQIERQLAVAPGRGLHLVATPIGNLGDITIRALAVLAQSDVIYCEDTRHSRTLLAHYRIDRPLRSYHEHNGEAERPRILAMLAAGRTVALISDAGTPLVSDPGYKLVRSAIEAGHRVVALPGPSAVLGGLAMSGLPTDTFLFAGFLPSKAAARRTRLAELAKAPATLVLFEAPSRLADTLDAMAELPGSREVVVAREMTKRFEEVRRGPAHDLVAWARSGEAKGEIVLMLAPPGTAEVTDQAIAAELAKALVALSLRDAARAVSDRLGVPKARVYDIGLKVKAENS